MDKRKIDIISIITIGAVFIIFYSAFLKDDIAAFRSLRSKRSSLREAISRDTEIIGAEKGKVADLLNLEKEIKEYKLLLSEKERVPYFLDYISSLSRQYKIDIISIEPGGTVEDGLLTKTVFTTEIKGEFPSLYHFLYHLEDDWRGVKVETLSFTKGSEDNIINVRLTLLVLTIEGYGEKA